MFKKWWIISLFLGMVATSSATIVEETGSLEGFVLGQCPGCAYNNFVSHISEGIAREGLNDYGPNFLDPQTNGFGSFILIEEGATGDSILSVWQQVFTYCLAENWIYADAVLSYFDTLFRYELAHLHDGETEYYMVRERLDSSYFDDNVDSIQTDDVTGSFRNGWGLYVFRVNAPRGKAIIQMPHPEDDFVSLPVGLRLFTTLGARLLMIAAAGREVAWDTAHPPYDNSKSLSDPTRNSRTVFHKCHQVAFAALDDGPLSPSLTIQVHSYDGSNYGYLPDIQMSAFRDDWTPNLPVRDRAEHKDFIHFLGEYPVSNMPAVPGLQVRINAYLGLYCNPPYAYYGTNPPISLMSSQELSGWGWNRQALVSHANHDIYVDPENFVHIEMDEFPDSLDERMTWSELLPGLMPATMTTYGNILAYYGSLIASIDSALTYNEAHPDTVPPDTSWMITATQVGPGSVDLMWYPQAIDRNFESYWIYYDTADVSMNSPAVSRADIPDLWNFELLETTLEGLDETLVLHYHFSIAGKDIYGHSAPLTPPIGLVSAYGWLMGTVRDGGTTDPIRAEVQVVGGTEQTTASESGQYSLFLLGNSAYTVRYSLWGYVSQEHTVYVAEDDTTYNDVDLDPHPVITLFSDDFESGAPGWTHSSPPSWGDQWHISSERAHGGTHSWKCANNGNGDYNNLLDARLTSPVIPDIPNEARLYFWMQIEGELSWTFPDSAYDGGILEISADGGPFQQVMTVGGYPKTFRWQPATGPMPGQPCWADDPIWVEEIMDLQVYAGQSIQFRFRFGSDASRTNEGWYVDDVLAIALDLPDISVPTGLVIAVEGDDLRLRWNSDANYGYRVYSDDNLYGSFTTLVGETTETELVIVGGAAAAGIKFYMVRGWNGALY
ncbi:MAG: carboxypeptidase-like regulatory domain-containing protein [bacterium]